MMYYPREEGMWDTWMFHYEGTFHLFYLQQQPVEAPTTTRIGHATSPDLLHWTEQQPTVSAGGRGDWDEGLLGTGMVFQHGGKFYMTYCAGFGQGKSQKIGLASSDDLFNWEKHPANPIIKPSQGGGIYEATPSEIFGGAVSCRDAFVTYDEKEKLFHALLTMRLAKGSYARRGCIAHAVSNDLADWKLLPPVYAPGQFVNQEVPERFAFNGKHYLFWAAHQTYGNHYEIPERPYCGGTYYAVSKEPWSGFRAPENNLLVGSGSGRFDNYVGRILEIGDEKILYYQMIGGSVINLVTAAAPKTLEVGPDGNLIVRYCRRLEGLKKRQLLCGAKSDWLDSKKLSVGESWDVKGDVVSASVDASYILPTDVDVGSFMLECEMMIEDGYFAGVGVSTEEQPFRGVKGGAVLDARRSMVHVIGDTGAVTGPVLRPLDSAKFSMRKGRFHHLRVMARGSWTDVFFDDNLYFSLALPLPERGRIVLFAGDARARFSKLLVHEIE